jgi:hypothetical protein
MNTKKLKVPTKKNINLDQQKLKVPTKKVEI